MKIAILMTCFNRRDVTLLCLQKLFEQIDIEKVEIYLVDDASSDGTQKAVRQNFPTVHLLGGNGRLFWNGGMRIAFAAAMERGFDAYLWLNDDSLLYPDAFKIFR
jgi:GT2 family glycosyltransferase